MFTFCVQRDTIKVEARDFGKEPAEAIRDEIHRRYANKVLPDVGLCISLLDIISASEGAVLYGDGCFYYKTVFRLIIFRPFIGEAILGTVVSSSEAGLTISVGFFDDILVPPTGLPNFCGFDPNRQRFFWAYPGEVEDDDDEDDADEEMADPTSSSPHKSSQSKQAPAKKKRRVVKIPTLEYLMETISIDDRMYIENKAWVRLRVVEEKFDDTEENLGAPVVQQPALLGGAGGGGGAATTGGVTQSTTKALKAPYSIIASMSESGLGCLTWWDNQK